MERVMYTMKEADTRRDREGFQGYRASKMTASHFPDSRFLAVALTKKEHI